MIFFLNDNKACFGIKYFLRLGQNFHCFGDLFLQNTIVLITNNEKFAQKVQKKIFLLRNTDEFKIIGTPHSIEMVKKIEPVLIFYHLPKEDSNSEEFLNFVQKIKQTNGLKTVSIILVYEEIDEDFLCSAFERGITDFMPADATDSEYTIRTIWCLQKREQSFENESSKDILSQLKIIDKANHVYTENYTYTILKEESKKNWGSFVVVAPDINIRSKISPQTLMNTIKKTVRACDILGYATDFKIYLWFRQTSKEDVIKILEKIKVTLTSGFSISAGFIETKNLAFDEAEELANKALSKALLKGNTFLYAKEPKKKEVNIEANVKNFKLHKENFVKKLEAILSPLFYQTQKRNEEKLFETKITQSVNEEKSWFKLENENGKSSFEISCPGFTKINIQVIHDIKDSEMKAEKLYIERDELTEEKIDYLLNSFIKDFQNYTNS